MASPTAAAAPTPLLPARLTDVMRLLCQIVSVSYDIWSGGVRYFGGKALDCLLGRPEPFEFTRGMTPADRPGPIRPDLY